MIEKIKNKLLITGDDTPFKLWGDSCYIYYDNKVTKICFKKKWSNMKFEANFYSDYYIIFKYYDVFKNDIIEKFNSLIEFNEFFNRCDSNISMNIDRDFLDLLKKEKTMKMILRKPRIKEKIIILQYGL